MERHAARLQRLDLLGHDVADDDLVAELGEAGARDEADPARTENADRSAFTGAGAYLGIGCSSRAIASIVSFDSSSFSVFTTQ